MTTEAAEATGAVHTEAGDTTQTLTTEVAETNPPAEATGEKPVIEGEKPTTETKAEDPVVYDFKAPEGVELAAEDVDAFKAIATELKLKPEDAQRVVDLAIKREQARGEAFAAQVTEWGEQVKADKEIGGAKLDENLGLARKAVDQFGSEGFKSLLDSTGMGNHPEVVRMMVKIGKALSEDKVVRGTPATQVKDHAQLLYGSTTP